MPAIITKDFRIIIQDNNGKFRFLGLYNGLKGSIQEQIGTNRNEFNGYAFTFEGKEEINAPYLLDLDDFSINASSEEMAGLFKGINIVAKKLGISTEVGKGYRALANISDDGGQEVPHLHFHLFGGEKVGKMVE